MMDSSFNEALAKAPVVAILRHLKPEAAVAVGEALVGAGVLIVEVPLNGHDALASLDLLSKGLRTKALVGAGTVLKPQDVSTASACGARFLFSPNLDPDVMVAARRLNLPMIPGVATPSEAFSALKQGATALKLFPGEMIPPPVIKAFRTVLPSDVSLIISGGVNVDNINLYADVGVNGFGVASAVFAPGLSPEVIGKNAKTLISALKKKES